MIKIIWTSNNLHHDIVPFCWSAKEDHFFEANEKTLSPNKKRKPIMTYIPTLNFKNTMNQFIFHFTGFYYAWEKERKQAHLIFTLRIDDKTIQYFCCFKMHLEYSPHLLKKKEGWNGRRRAEKRGQRREIGRRESKRRPGTEGPARTAGWPCRKRRMNRRGGDEGGKRTGDSQGFWGRLLGGDNATTHRNTGGYCGLPWGLRG